LQSATVLMMAQRHSGARNSIDASDKTCCLTFPTISLNT